MLRTRSLTVLALLVVFTAAAALLLDPSSSKRNIGGALKSLSPSAMAAVHSSAAGTLEGRPLAFEPNVGQADPRVKFLSHGPGYNLFLTADQAVFSFALEKQSAVSRSSSNKLPQAGHSRPNKAATVGMSLLGANSNCTVEGLDLLPGDVNYLIGNDRTRWRTHISTFAKVKDRNVYPGVDLVYYGNQRRLEYDFEVAPRANPRQIRLVFTGAKSIRIEPATGDLLIKTLDGADLRQVRPRIYQQVENQKREVAGRFQLLDHRTVTFALADYDPDRAVIIDPSVVFTTFIEGYSEDFPVAIAADQSGNSYITGFTLSTDPSTDGAYPLVGGVSVPAKNCELVQELVANADFDIPLNCQQEAFLTKLSPTGAILFSTYIGGSGFDVTRGVAVDSTGVYVAGLTNSPDFGTGQYAFAGGQWGNAFVAKFTLTGDAVSYVTRWGGGGASNEAFAIALDSSHAAYIAGTTCSVDFPTSQYFSATSPWQKAYNGNCDAFVGKLDASGNQVYGTYLGGSSNDEARGIAVDNRGYAYVTGDTCSFNFPDFNTNGMHGFPGFGCEEGDGYTAFVSKVLPDGSGGLYSFYLGGTRQGDVVPADIGQSIAVDALGEAYVTGLTVSPNFFTTSGALQKTIPCGGSGLCQSAFVAKVFPLGSVGFSTYFGASVDRTVGDSIAVNVFGQIYVAGRTDSTVGLPGAPALTPNPYAGFLTKLSPSLDSVVFTTLLGAEINSIALTRPTSLPGIITSFFSTSIYTTGFRYRPGSDVSDPTNADAFVVKENDSPLLTLF